MRGLGVSYERGTPVGLGVRVNRKATHYGASPTWKLESLEMDFQVLRIYLLGMRFEVVGDHVLDHHLAQRVLVGL